MTWANPSEFHQFDPKLERNMRKSCRRLEFGCSTEGAPSSSKATSESASPESPLVIDISSNPFPESKIKEDRMVERTLKELAASDATTQKHVHL